MSIKDQLDQAGNEQELAAGLRVLATHKRKTNELRALVKSLTLDNDALATALELALGENGSEPIVVPKPKVKSKTKSPVAVVGLWSDWHVDELVPPEQTNGLNTYNPAVVQYRFGRLIENTIKMMRREMIDNTLTDLVIWLGGDFISGHIHDDLVEVTTGSPLDSMFEVEGMLLEALRALADAAPCRVRVPTSWGNHGRTNQGRPRVATAGRHNLEQTCYRRLARDLADDDRFQFDVSESAFKYVTLGDYTIRFNHGDAGIKYQGGLAGLTAPLNRAVARWDEERHADMTCIGHWHVPQAGKAWIVNGSLIGTNEYSRRFGHTEPEQTVFSVDLERNRRGPVSPIFLD